MKHSFPVCTVRVTDSPASTEVELPAGNNSLIDEYVVINVLLFHLFIQLYSV